MTQTRDKVAFAFFGLLLLVYAAANIVASQMAYAPVMFRVMSLRDAKGAQEFLVNLEGSGIVLKEGLHSYDVEAMQSDYLNGLFNNSIARAVDVERLNVEKSIAYHESLLDLNRDNPQLLIKVGLLYKERGDSDRSAEYFKLARSIDPWVKVK